MSEMKRTELGNGCTDLDAHHTVVRASMDGTGIQGRLSPSGAAGESPEKASKGPRTARSCVDTIGSQRMGMLTPRSRSRFLSERAVAWALTGVANLTA